MIPVERLTGNSRSLSPPPDHTPLVGPLPRCPACDGRRTCAVVVDVLLCHWSEGPQPGLGDLGPLIGLPGWWVYRWRQAARPGVTP